MKLKKAKQDILRFTGNFVLYYLINVLCKSLRVTVKNEQVISGLDSRKQKFIVAFWHGTMLLPWYMHSNKNFAALTSKSKDGNLLAKILKSWKYKVVRGSSSDGGKEALEIMVNLTLSGYSLAITPDGPRGPVHEMKAGAVVTAKKSGLPLVLAGVGFEKKKLLKSWDSFQVPGFFSRANIIYSEPVYVDAGLSFDETSEVIKNCEEKLNALQKQAENF